MLIAKESKSRKKKLPLPLYIYCGACREQLHYSKQPIICINLGCMQRKDDRVTTALSEGASRDLAVLFEVKYTPKEAEEKRNKPRRRNVFTEIALEYSYAGQAEIHFCSFRCLRRYLKNLVDHVESHSQIGSSKKDPCYRMTTFPPQPGKKLSRRKSKKRVSK